MISQSLLGKFCRLLKSLGSAKGRASDKIPMIIHKKLSPKLSQTLSKLFKHCVKEEYSPDLWKVSDVRTL